MMEPVLLHKPKAKRSDLHPPLHNQAGQHRRNSCTGCGVCHRIARSPAASGSLTLKNLSPDKKACAARFLQQNYGNHAVARLVQTKLRIGTPGDVYEQEADRVAEQVMRMPDGHTHDTRIQRKCPRCTKGREMDKKDEKIQTKETPDQTPEVTPRIETNINALMGSGQPLPESVRSFFEPRFGYDFSQVRIHDDAPAAESARALSSHAFTIGHNIVFAAGRYDPQIPAGRRLLAHELVHVIQQSSAGGTIQRREVCDENGVCRSEPEEELNYTPNIAAVAGASLMPPGDCTPAEHRALQDVVNKACKGERRCTQNDDCATIWKRIQNNADCIKARSTINAKCFRGGDLGHIAAVAAAVGALANCWAVYNRKCQPKTPPVPVRVPVPEEKPKPVVDKGFMDKMAEITGLTGAALVLYIIVSEGTRLFPPRNLVPVP